MPRPRRSPRRTPPRPLLALAAGALAVPALLAGCSSGGSTTADGRASAGASASGAPVPSGPAPSPGSAPIAWRACDQAGVSGLKAADQCATLAVPVDHDRPTGAALSLQLVRRRATDAGRRLGSLLINPGGPGGSTVKDFDDLTDQLSDTLRARFDVVGFDPRGVGASRPAVRCADGPTLDRLLADSPDPASPDLVQRLTDDARALVQACEQNTPADLLAHVSTVDAAKDVDALRAALGEQKTTYLGYSYGTLLGATYASLFPDRVRALVLDGAVDPALDSITGTEVQAVGFEQSLQAFLRDCQSRGSRCAWHPGGDLLQAFRALLRQVQQQPLPTGDSARPLTSSLFLTGVAATLYSRDSWTYLEQGLAAAASGDGRILLALADFLNERDQNGTYSNLTAANLAVNCSDEYAPTDPQAYVASYRRLQRTAPDFATFALSLTCAQWPHRPTAQRTLVVKGAPPLLVVGSTGDPATPYREAQALVKDLPGSVLLTRDGQGHTGYGASACVRQHADAYLVDPLQLPAPGTTCPS